PDKHSSSCSPSRLTDLPFDRVRTDKEHFRRSTESESLTSSYLYFHFSRLIRMVWKTNDAPHKLLISLLGLGAPGIGELSSAFLSRAPSGCQHNAHDHPRLRKSCESAPTTKKPAHALMMTGLLPPWNRLSCWRFRWSGHLCLSQPKSRVFTPC